MEFNEDQDQLPLDDSTPEPEETASGTYSGAGVGKIESPYADSPYYSNYHTQPEPEPESGSYAWNNDFRQPKKAKKKPGLGRRIVAAALAAAVVAGSCGVTAWLVNGYWEDRTAAMEANFERKLDALEEDLDAQIDALSQQGGTSGGVVMMTDGLTPAQVYAQNVECVVGITNTMTMTSSSGWYGQGQSYTAQSTGSGFIISEDGYIITNYHVIDGYESLTVTTHLGEEYEAKLVGGDETNDVALLKVEATGLKPVTIGSSDDLIVGDMVVAIGNPLGELTATQTVGYVSGKDRSVSTDGSIINMIQTDAAINSGNSGGPLFNMKGQVIGITTAKYSGESSSGATIEGIGFAIPIDDVMSMIEDFKNYGYLKNQAYLGVSVYGVDASVTSLYGVPQGSYVESVVEGGSADRAGVQPGDIIIAVGEYTVDGNSSLTAALRKFSAGDTTTITVSRSGQEVTLDITFDERPADPEAETTQPTEPGELPENGSFEDWYDSFFGDGN